MFDDTDQSYGELSMLAHWVAAMFIVALLVIGLAFEALPRGDARTTVTNLHVSIGLIALPFLLWRVYWRVKRRFPAPLPSPGWQVMLAKAVHVLLLADILVLAITGPLAVWSLGHGLDLFGWFAIPSPIGRMTVLQEAVETIHITAAKPVMLPLLTLHILGVLKHVLLDRGSSMERMASFGRPV